MGGGLCRPISAPKRAKKLTRANCVSVYLAGLTGGCVRGGVALLG